MKEINTADLDGDSKKFHTLLKKATQYKRAGVPLRGIREGEEQITGEKAIEKRVGKYFGLLYHDLPRDEEAVEEIHSSKKLPIFTAEDIDNAILACNFSKGLGPDGFDGKLLEDPGIRKKVVDFLVESCNKGTFPQYMKQGRLVLLSKTVEEIAEVGNTRPIIVLPHLTKIAEKAIVAKLE